MVLARYRALHLGVSGTGCKVSVRYCKRYVVTKPWCSSLCLPKGLSGHSSRALRGEGGAQGLARRDPGPPPPRPLRDLLAGHTGGLGQVFLDLKEAALMTEKGIIPPVQPQKSVRGELGIA